MKLKTVLTVVATVSVISLGQVQAWDDIPMFEPDKFDPDANYNPERIKGLCRSKNFSKEQCDAFFKKHPGYSNSGSSSPAF